MYFFCLKIVMNRAWALLFSHSARITPDKVVAQLVFKRVCTLMVNCHRSFDGVDFCQVFKGGSNSTMNTKDLIVHQSCEGHLLEEPIDPSKERVRLIDIFLELEGAFFPESHTTIDYFILMCSSEEDKILWKLYF